MLRIRGFYCGCSFDIEDNVLDVSDQGILLILTLIEDNVLDVEEFGIRMWLLMILMMTLILKIMS